MSKLLKLEKDIDKQSKAIEMAKDLETKVHGGGERSEFSLKKRRWRSHTIVIFIYLKGYCV